MVHSAIKTAMATQDSDQPTRAAAAMMSASVTSSAMRYPNWAAEVSRPSSSGVHGDFDPPGIYGNILRAEANAVSNAKAPMAARPPAVPTKAIPRRPTATSNWQ